MANLENFTPPASSILEGLAGLSIIRQIGLLVGIAASVAIGVGAVLWTQETNYRPLYTDISHIDAAQVSDLLQTEKIPFKIDTDTHMLMVEGSKIDEARLKLAAAGFSSGDAVGYELLDKDSSFGTSQFMEKARYNRSLEGELSKTISSIQTVKSARVHLAIPKQAVFVGDDRKPSASVLVDLFPGRTLEKTQISAIEHLVASSVPEMLPKDVTVVDQQGNLLSDHNTDEAVGLAAKKLEYTHQLESIYHNRVANILEPIVGRDHFKTEVTADVDFTQVEQASESYNPDLPALRSEQLVDESAGDGSVVAGVPGSASNKVTTSNGAVNNNQEVSNRRSQATRNYELDRVISHTQQSVGNLKRLSVAIVVDNLFVNEVRNNKTVSVKRPVPAAEIERIKSLIKDTVGFDAQRGDTVSVMNQAFIDNSKQQENIPEESFWQKPWFIDTAKQGFGILLIVALVLGVLRPILKNLSVAGTASVIAEESEQFELATFKETIEEEEEAAEEGEENIIVAGGPETLLPEPGMGYEEQLDTIKNLVAEDPGLVAQVVRQWVSNE